MKGGKSKSVENRFGVRSRVKGIELAPRSLRKKGKRLLSEWSKEEVEKALRG